MLKIGFAFFKHVPSQSHIHKHNFIKFPQPESTYIPKKGPTGEMLIIDLRKP